MTNEEKLNSETYFVETVTTQIIETKKRLDRLVFLLILFSAVGAIYYKEPPEGLNIVVSKITPFGYHLGISFGLLGIFALIGSKFIDYITKRKKIDDYLLNNDFLISNYKLSYIPYPDEPTPNQIEINKLHYISRTVVPSSFYEFFYTLFFSKKDLRLPSVYVLMTIFMISHAVSIIHAVQVFEGDFDFLAAIVLFAVYTVLYGGFLNSIKKYREALHLPAYKYAAFFGILTLLALMILKACN
ncbi:hypothetical protein [uncultured Kordia sp.]|uniref:hypothetical protein n=1 Tax=uncultured Kordia sp. TaxID=507699 RepID=UPI002636F0D9|nr:hypothetical protein [uncultured Kordia sp.]